MERIDTVTQMQQRAEQWRREGLRISLVPTMGFLHAGHMSLVHTAHEQADRVIVSIFVNPTQFGANEDLDAYPRDLERDLAMCQEAGVHAVFHPSAGEMYPADASTWVLEESLSLPLCGGARPGHFRGVTTVVAKLFLAALPHCAVFGQKDAQQALVIQRMVRDLNFPVELIIAPIVRESDGLAMSSRNKYLSSEERTRALGINRGLRLAEESWRQGTTASEMLIKIVAAEIVASGGDIDYIQCVSTRTLEPIESITVESLIAVAARYGPARLIDNVILSKR